jgi:hypothetical protein
MGFSLGLDSLALFRRWATEGGSWEEFIATSGDSAAGELLAWDAAVALVSAEPYVESGGGLLPRPTARIVRASHDLPALSEGLALGNLELREEAVTLAVHRTPTGIATTRVESTVADLLEELRAAPGPAPEALRPVLDTLETAGLIRYT